jgi:hypothetical protein
MAEGVRDLKQPATDFAAAFTHGRRFEHNGWKYQIAVEQIANIRLPSGQIVAHDPADLDDFPSLPFKRTVPAGKYPVDLSICHIDWPAEKRQFSYIACMRIRFSDLPVASWLIATVRGQDPDRLQPLRIFGYGVDAGLGSFCDCAALKSLLQKLKRQKKSYFDDFYLKRVIPAYDLNRGHFADVVLDRSTGANIVLCTSGVGDGFYATYWGLDNRGKPVCLVTDFGLLKHDIHETRSLGRVGELLGRRRTLRLPGGVVRIRVKRWRERRLIVELRGPGAETCSIEVRRNGRIPASDYGIHGGRDEKIDLGIIFKRALPDDAVLFLEYTDCIVPL